MKFDIDRFREILDTLSRNKSRSFLTGFGVFWGVFMLVALLGIVGALAKSKPLMIVMGVLGILAGAALLLFDLLIALPTTGFDGFVDLLTSNFKSNSVWVYIAAGLTVLGAILCIVTAALTKKKPNVQKIM